MNLDVPGVVRYAKGATQSQFDEAKAILEALDFAYPDHPWSVEISGDGTGGRVFIRHLAFKGGNWGMNLKHSKNDTAFYSSSAFKRRVIMMAGEWLERVGLPRKMYDRDHPLMNKADGVPAPEKLPVDIVIDATKRELRESPRPQVIQQLEEESWPLTGST